MSAGVKYCLGVGVLLALLLFMSLFVGPVSVPSTDVLRILTGHQADNESWSFIILRSRLPQSATAMLCGASLAVSGLMLQTTFRNPLAGPDIFGINSGAALAVALVMLSPWGFMHGSASLLTAAFVGAIAVMSIIFLFARHVRNSAMLLIVGIMIGFVASSVVSLLNFFATEGGLRAFVMWGMGNFDGVSVQQMPLFVGVSVAGLIASLLLIKPLNAFLLGAYYAENLGVDTRRLRNILLLITGLLTAVATAYCGPVSFLGLAVPHLARFLLSKTDHRQLLPITMLCGAAIALLCNVLCHLPISGGVIPLNAVTPLVGAPVIIYVIARKRI